MGTYLSVTQHFTPAGAEQDDRGKAYLQRLAGSEYTSTVEPARLPRAAFCAMILSSKRGVAIGSTPQPRKRRSAMVKHRTSHRAASRPSS